MARKPSAAASAAAPATPAPPAPPEEKVYVYTFDSEDPVDEFEPLPFEESDDPQDDEEVPA